MIIAILIALVSGIYVEVNLNTETIIHESTQLVINDSLIYDENTPHSCYLKQQRLGTHKGQNSSIQIIDFDESQFKQHFQNGHFEGHFDSIITMIHIPGGAVILNSLSQLIHVHYAEEKFSLKSIFQLEKQVTQVNIEYLSQSQQILLLSVNFTTIIELDLKSNDIFAGERQFSERFSSITATASVGNMLFVAEGKKGLLMFEVTKSRLLQHPTGVKSRNITDLKVYREYDIYFIFALDYEQGLQNYIYNGVNTLFSEDLKWTRIRQGGYMMDIYGEILIIVQEFTYYSVAFCFKLNFTTKTWILVSEHRVQKIIDLDITDDYAILITENGHEVIFHSVKNAEVTTQIQLPSLKRVQFFTNEFALSEQNKYSNSEFIFGVSRHRFFFAKITIVPNQIVCYTNETQEIDTHFRYEVNTTKGNQIQEYRVHFIRPWITGDMKFVLYSLSIGIVVSFAILMTVLIRQYCIYAQNVNSLVNEVSFYEQNPKSHEVTLQINTFDSPNKFAKFGSQSQLSQIMKE